MTYKEFKHTMKMINKGYDRIYIGEVGYYSNADARSKMGYYLGVCPIEYCEQLLRDVKEEGWFGKEV
tara:strand:- start:925 stop:1125 length:201 start_codon:yes stop_codon:yes gene_type:complete